MRLSSDEGRGQSPPAWQEVNFLQFLLPASLSSIGRLQMMQWINGLAQRPHMPRLRKYCSEYFIVRVPLQVRLKRFSYWSTNTVCYVFRSFLSYLRPAWVDDHFTRPLVVTIWYHVLTRPLNRRGPSRRLVHLSGMAFHSNCALFHVVFRARFIVSLKHSFLPGPGLGALLSSYHEGALYKFHR